MMTDRARDLGMKNSTFANSNGWPAAGHRMSMRDLGILANRLITDFPTFYPLFNEQEFAFDGRVPANSQNRNPLLGLGIGADGLKTGHTSEAGYGLVGSAKQGDRRVIFVIAGLDSADARSEEAERIVNWAFRQFAERDLPETGTRVAQADVWMGAESTVGIVIAEDVRLLMPFDQLDEIDAEIVYQSPIDAPVSEGQTLGEMIVRREQGLPEVRIPLVAEADVAEGAFTVKLRAATLVLLNRFAPNQASVLEPLIAPEDA